MEITEIRIHYLETVMYYNCGIAITKRQTKLKLHFVIQCAWPYGPMKTYGFPRLFPDHFAIPWLSQVSGHPVTIMRVHPVYFMICASAKWPPTFRPRQLSWLLFLL